MRQDGSTVGKRKHEALEKTNRKDQLQSISNAVELSICRNTKNVCFSYQRQVLLFNKVNNTNNNTNNNNNNNTNNNNNNNNSNQQLFDVSYKVDVETA